MRCGQRAFRAEVGMALLASAAVVALVASGCARGGGIGGPTAVMDIMARYNGQIDDTAYYFVAFNANGDFGKSGPLPVAAGPFWGNGWGTGSISYFVEYHLGAYTVYRANLAAVLSQLGQGITAATGAPSTGDAGTHTITVTNVAFGTPVVSGTGTITAASNASDQNAGTFSIQTDGTGKTVTGAVTFAPAADGGHTPDPASQAQLAALNAGGVTLTTSSVSAFGLTLTLGAPAAGTQTIQVPPAVGTVRDVFNDTVTGQTTTTTTTTIQANSSTATATPPIPGLTITTSDLTTTGQAAIIQLVAAGTLTALGEPFDKTLPTGGNTLRFTLDMATFGGAANLSTNIISTSQIILDPTITDPRQHTYDALGPLGNDYVTFSTNDFRTFSNATAFRPEGAGDITVQGPGSDAQRNAVDLVDWSITLRRL